MSDRVEYRTGARALAAMAAGLLALMLAGCPAAEPELEIGEPRPGGTAVVSLRSDFAGVNSITNTALYTDELIKYALFTPLVQYDAELNVVPHLAESWELEGDTAVVFRLRRDVRWHDGQPVTAEDVAFTFERAKDPATASLIGTAYLGQVHTAEVLDTFAIRFGMEPHAQALESFWWAPMPRHLLEHVPPAGLRNAPFNRRPVGSGPYRFVEWRANERFVIERNEDFPEALGGPPHPDRVVFRVIPEAATRLTEHLTGRVHVNLEVEPDQVGQIEANPELEPLSFPGRLFGYIGWNNAREPFTRPAVRRAMTLAINRQEIVDALLFGHGVTAIGPIPPWHPYHPRELEPLPYDPDGAAELLDAAGWRLDARTGIRHDEAGRPLRFTLMTSDADLSRAVVEVVQAHLRRVGVDVRLQIVEFGTLIAAHRERNFDAVFSNWVLDNFQMASTPMALFHSQWVDIPLSTNRSSFADPRADELIERGLVAADPAEARAVWRDFTALLQELQPLTFMFWRNTVSGVDRRLQDVTMDPRGELLSIRHWWLAGRGPTATAAANAN